MSSSQEDRPSPAEMRNRSWNASVYSHYSSTVPPFLFRPHLEQTQCAMQGTPGQHAAKRPLGETDCGTGPCLPVVREEQEGIGTLRSITRQTDHRQSKKLPRTSAPIQFQNKLKAVVYTYIASQLYSNKDKEILLKAFKEIDADGDGVI